RKGDADEARDRRSAGDEVGPEVPSQARRAPDLDARRASRRGDRAALVRRGREKGTRASGRARKGEAGRGGGSESAAGDFQKALSFSVHPLAEIEYLEAASFYEKRLFGLGLDFVDELERSVRSILAQPFSAPLVRGPVRRNFFSDFLTA